jgi:hypothetical protein
VTDAAEVVCFQVSLLLGELNVKPRRSISSPRWKPEMVPLRCDPESSCRVPPLEKMTPLAVPPDATPRVPPLNSQHFEALRPPTVATELPVAKEVNVPVTIEF